MLIDRAILIRVVKREQRAGRMELRRNSNGMAISDVVPYRNNTCSNFPNSIKLRRVAYSRIIGKQGGGFLDVAGIIQRLVYKKGWRISAISWGRVPSTGAMSLSLTCSSVLILALIKLTANYIFSESTGALKN